MTHQNLKGRKRKNREAEGEAAEIAAVAGVVAGGEDEGSKAKKHYSSEVSILCILSACFLLLYLLIRCAHAYRIYVRTAFPCAVVGEGISPGQ